MLALALTYTVIGLAAGYACARTIYRQPHPGEVLKDHDLTAALIAWLILGAAWPLLAVGALLFLLGKLWRRRPSGRGLGDRLFGR